MSAYKCLKCSIVDKNTLVKALNILGLKHNVHDTPQKLEGFGGDQRSQSAEIVVKRSELNEVFTGASNDLGFRWNPNSNEYEMIVSDYDLHCGVKGRVIQAYAKVAIEQAMKLNRFSVTKSTEINQLNQKARVKVNIIAKKVI